MPFSSNNYLISDFIFIKVGFFLALLSVVLLFTYPIAKRKPRIWGQRFVQIIVGIFVIGGGLNFAYAFVSGEWADFIRAFEFSTFLELSALAIIPFLVMAFMAFRAVASLPEQPSGPTQIKPSNPSSQSHKK